MVAVRHLLIGLLDFGRRLNRALSSQPLRRVSDLVRRNAIQPCRKRRAPPFEPSYVGERLVKDVGYQIFRLGAVPDTARHVRVDAVEMSIVQIAKTRRVALRRLDQQAFFGPLALGLP